VLTRVSIAELNNWLISAFNGEWLRTQDPVPIKAGDSGRRKFKRELDNLLLMPD
jgi:hypothetical protein